MILSATVDECLVSYNGDPMIVKAHTTANKHLLAVAFYGSDEGSEWLAAEFSQETMDQIVGGQVDLRSAFTELRVGKAYTGIFNGQENESIRLSQMRSEPDDICLPDNGYFIDQPVIPAIG